MPAVGFIRLDNGGFLSFDEAPSWYEQNTEIPAEAIRLIADGEGDPRRRGTNLSPSVAYADSTCVRELAIRKFIPYYIDGVTSWLATEGTAWHKAFESVTPEADDEYYREVLLPDFFEIFVPGKDKYTPPCTWATNQVNWDPELNGPVRLFEYVKDVHSSYEIEIFPGIWMNGKIDKLRQDMTRIEDFKTKAWSGWKNFKTGAHQIKHYPPDMDQTIQLNLYRRMVEVMTGVNPQELVIRRMYRGARVSSEAWKKYDIRVMSNDELEDRIRPHIERATKIFADLKALEDNGASTKDLLQCINLVELDGNDKSMFAGRKCTEYCEVSGICFKLAGLEMFDETRVGAICPELWGTDEAK